MQNKYVKINLNDKIKVKLTAHGLTVYKDFYKKFNIPALSLKIDEDGYAIFQLWDFIHIFGDEIHIGARNVIAPLDILVEIDE